MFSVNNAIAIYHTFRKGHMYEPFGKFTYSTIIQSFIIANTHTIHMEHQVSARQRGRQRFQLIHLKGDVNNNNSCPPTFNWTYVPRSFPTTRCLPKDKIKRNRGKTLTLCIKINDRPFAEGSRGCHALLILDALTLSAKERHMILPLMIATFIMQSVAFILCHHKFVPRLFSLTIKDRTYLGAIFIALLHR